MVVLHVAVNGNVSWLLDTGLNNAHYLPLEIRLIKFKVHT